MKNLILSAAVLFTVVISANAANTYPENQKVITTFNQIFKNATNVVWSQPGEYYEASFTSYAIKTRALLDARGNLVQTIRYYKEDRLPANVLYHVKKAYPQKDIWGITEVSNSNGVNYRIVLKDDKKYTNINANTAGDTEVVSEYERGDK